MSFSFFKRNFLLFLLLTIFSFACNDNPRTAATTGNFGITADTVMNYHQNISKAEDQQIEDFVSRYGWKMTKTPTGLRYLIYHKGSGHKALKDQVAVCRYSLKLLNGQEVYRSEKEGMKEFRIGHGGVENGLEEGILLLKVGDRAKFIVPSHLAFGLLGDQNRIPPGATLVYDIELVQLKQNQSKIN